ncbi:unnamed protein product [Ectocarpus fasciculatus]
MPTHSCVISRPLTRFFDFSRAWIVRKHELVQHETRVPQHTKRNPGSLIGSLLPTGAQRCTSRSPTCATRTCVTNMEQVVRSSCRLPSQVFVFVTSCRVPSRCSRCILLQHPRNPVIY